MREKKAENGFWSADLQCLPCALRPFSFLLEAKRLFNIVLGFFRERESIGYGWGSCACALLPHIYGWVGGEAESGREID